MTDRPLTIVLADDHGVVRAGLRLLLEKVEDFEVLAEAGDVEGALAAAAEQKPDVLVLDLNMPGGPGRTSLAILPELHNRSPATRVVILTMQDDAAFARTALSAGARGYVLKESADTELVDAVRAVAAGQVFLNPRLGAEMAGADDVPADHGPLSAREWEVLRLIALGHTNSEIAEQLFLSVRTIESHRASIQQKLDLHSRAELVRYALEHGLVGG
ncbi:MAG: response regulator transcription factor [Baekduia sp.]